MDVTMHSCWLLWHVSIRAIYCQVSILLCVTGDPSFAYQRNLQKDPKIMDILEANYKKILKKKEVKIMSFWTFF